MLKILAIGNSFSRDATAYLHDLAAAAGTETRVVNLYIPGCSLKTHCENIAQDLAAYEEDENGKVTGEKTGIRQTLTEDVWDVVTLQQVSGNSGIPESYDPYLTELSDYVARYAPQARQWIHQTWAYELGSSHPSFGFYDDDQHKMYEALVAAYERAAQKIQAPVIRSGEVIQALRRLPPFQYENGGMSLCCDGFHMSTPYGRYAVAATWLKTLAGVSAAAVPYAPYDADPALLKLIADTVDQVARP